MAALSLFPARIAFVNSDGTLTPEAFRALQIIYDRIGGAIGVNGGESFNDIVSTESLVGKISELTMQVQDLQTRMSEMQIQSVEPSAAYSQEMTFQPAVSDNGLFSNITYSGLLSGGKASFSAGTVGLPSLYFGSDTTTGFYRIGANNVGFSVSGVKVFELAPTGISASAINSTVIGNVTPLAGTFTNVIGSNLTVNGPDGLGLFISNSATGNPYISLWQTSTLRAYLQYLDATSAVGLVNVSGNVTLNPAGSVSLTASPTGVAVVGDITTSSTTLHKTSASLSNGAAAAAGTLLNAPSAGNPTKWVPINDNGTIRYIPTW